MYPSRELTRLADHKAGQRRAIARHRLAFTAAVDVIVQPVQWIDRVRRNLRRIALFAPLAILTIGFLRRPRLVAPRRRASRVRHWGRVLRFAVRGWGLLNALRAASRSH